MLIFKPDIPLARDDANRVMPWIIGFMVYLSCLALIFASNLGRYLSSKELGGESSYIVQMPAKTADDAATLESVKQAMRESGYFKEVGIIPELRVLELVEPWIGKQESGALQIPVMIEGKLAPDILVDHDRLRSLISSASMEAEVEDNAAWMKRLQDFTTSIRLVSLLAVALVVIITTAIIFLVCRTSVKLHSSTIEILNLVGATRNYIAKQFQQNLLRLAVKGSAIGIALLLPTLAPLKSMASKIGLPAFDSSSFPVEAIAIPLTVCFTLLLAYWLARSVVVRMLTIT